MPDWSKMNLQNRYGQYTLEGLDVDWLHPVYTVLVLHRPLVKMIDTVFEDHQVDVPALNSPQPQHEHHAVWGVHMAALSARVSGPPVQRTRSH